MNRRLTVLLSAMEAGIAVAIGIALPLVPLTILWAVHFGFGVDWLLFWRGAVDVWLLGHGVDVRFTLGEDALLALGVTGAEAPIPVTIALMGIGFVTLLLAARAGRRIAETGNHVVGAAVATAVFGLLGLGITAISLHDAARPSLVQTAFLPPCVFAAGLGLGMLLERQRRRRARGAQPEPTRAASGPLAWLIARFDDVWFAVPETGRRVILAALRGGLGTAALFTALSAVVLAGVLAVRYADIIRLYESLHGEVLGGIAVTVAELALLPNVLVWTMSWLLGPGFALGAGTTVSPISTLLGPIPALPILGAMPTGDSPFAFVGLLVPIASALLVAAALRRRLDQEGIDLAPLALAGVAVGSAIVDGLIIGVLAGASAGAAGPGRLAEVGPDGLVVGLVAAAMTALAGGLGLWLGGTVRYDRLASWRPGQAAESRSVETSPAASDSSPARSVSTTSAGGDLRTAETAPIPVIDAEGTSPANEDTPGVGA